MENKEFFIKAIDHYEPYSPAKREVLKIMVEDSVDNISSIGGKKIAALTHRSAAAISSVIVRLQGEGVIKNLENFGTRCKSYKINLSKLEHITNYYVKNRKVEK